MDGTQKLYDCTDEYGDAFEIHGHEEPGGDAVVVIRQGRIDLFGNERLPRGPVSVYLVEDDGRRLLAALQSYYDAS